MVLELGNLTSFHGFLQSEKLLLFLFLLVLGVVIATIAESGEGYGYVERLSQRLRSRSQAQLATIFLSFSLFIDDYLNALTTSSVMKNLTDKFRIPRLKLAFLTTAMAAPLCSLVPISSWAAAIIMFLLEAGISTSTESAIILADPFVTFSKSIPFIFFSLFLILGALFIVLGKISYGVMAEEEKKAASPEASVLGALHNPVSELPTVDYSKLLATHSTFNFFSPLLILSGAIFVAMLATGGYFSQGARLVPSLVAAKAELSLLLGALVGLGYTMLLFFLRAKINLHEALRAVKDGVMMMKDSLLVLALAWVLASFMRQDLGTGKYLAQFLMPFVSGEFLPVSVFLMSGAVAFSIGSAWATMAVIFPMVIPMVAEFAGITTPVAIDLVGSIYPVIGAVISGAIFGSSLSPIADLLVITSKNTKVDHFEYVKAQMQYLLPVGVGSALAFALVGVFGSSFSYFSSFLISVIPGFLATACLMLFLSFLNKA
jgi:Na+/H+ antiporter NhaC